jgi:hypothetical protein
MLMHLKIVYEMASNVEKLRDLGYSPGDVHYIHGFFKLGLLVLDPTRSVPEQEQEERARHDHLSNLISKGKFFLDQAIRFSLAGYTFGQVEFIQVEEKRDPEPENLKIHERHFYKGISKEVLRVPSGYIYSDYNAETDTCINPVFVPYNLNN